MWSQGRTLNGVVHVVDLSKNMIRARSLYVPWSRVRESVHLLIVFPRVFVMADLNANQMPDKTIVDYMLGAQQRHQQSMAQQAE